MQSKNILHVVKLAVGVRDVAHLAAIQKERAVTHAPLRHRTRNMPKRAEEITAGGSIYWVVNRVILVRQRITDIIEDKRDDGARCAALVLDPALVQVAPRSMKPFQGWRYLNAADAPLDLGDGGLAEGLDALPEKLRAELAHLALL